VQRDLVSLGRFAALESSDDGPGCLLFVALLGGFIAAGQALYDFGFGVGWLFGLFTGTLWHAKNLSRWAREASPISFAVKGLSSNLEAEYRFQVVLTNFREDGVANAPRWVHRLHALTEFTNTT
jgi:hypothetical protein